MTKKKDTGIEEVSDAEIGAFLRALFEDTDEEIEEDDDVAVVDASDDPVSPVVAEPAAPHKASVTVLPEPARWTPEMTTRLLFSQQDTFRYIWAFCIDKTGRCYVHSSDGTMYDLALVLQAATRVNAALGSRPPAPGAA